MEGCSYEEEQGEEVEALDSVTLQSSTFYFQHDLNVKRALEDVHV